MSYAIVFLNFEMHQLQRPKLKANSTSDDTSHVSDFLISPNPSPNQKETVHTEELNFVVICSELSPMNGC